MQTSSFSFSSKKFSIWKTAHILSEDCVEDPERTLFWDEVATPLSTSGFLWSHVEGMIHQDLLGCPENGVKSFTFDKNSEWEKLEYFQI